MKKELKNRIRPSKVLAVCLIASLSACSTSTMLGNYDFEWKGTEEGINAASDLFTGMILQSKRTDAKGDDAYYEHRREQTKMRGLSLMNELRKQRGAK